MMGRRKGAAGGLVQGAGSSGGAFLPCSCADRAGGLPMRGMGETLPYLPARSHAADPGVLGSQERGGERGFQKVCVMSPSTLPPPHNRLSASTLQGEWRGWGRMQGRRLQPGVGNSDTKIRGPAQVPA